MVGNPEMTKNLIKKGARICVNYNHKHSLQTAVTKNSHEILKVILEELTIYSGHLILSLMEDAIRSDKSSIFNLLLDHLLLDDNDQQNLNYIERITNNFNEKENKDQYNIETFKEKINNH